MLTNILLTLSVIAVVGSLFYFGTAAYNRGFKEANKALGIVFVASALLACFLLVLGVLYGIGFLLSLVAEWLAIAYVALLVLGFMYGIAYIEYENHKEASLNLSIFITAMASFLGVVWVLKSIWS